VGVSAAGGCARSSNNRRNGATEARLLSRRRVHSLSRRRSPTNFMYVLDRPCVVAGRAVVETVSVRA